MAIPNLLPVLTVLLTLSAPLPCWAQTSSLEAAAKAAGENAARRDVIQQVEQEARALRAPTGLLGAKWLMTMDDVRKARPQATDAADDTLAERVEVYQRSAVVHYVFKQNTLLLIVVSFEGKGTEESFQKTQTALDADFGPAPQATPSADYRLDSKKTLGRFVVRHTLLDTLGTTVEQIQFVRTGPKR